MIKFMSDNVNSDVEKKISSEIESDMQNSSSIYRAVGIVCIAIVMIYPLSNIFAIIFLEWLRLKGF
jgi:hypothetical protein